MPIFYDIKLCLSQRCDKNVENPACYFLRKSVEICYNTYIKVLLAAAGTAGHVNPALATATALQRLGVEVEFLGCNGIEQDLVKKAKYALHSIDKVPVYRELKRLHKNVALPAKLHKQVQKVRRILKNGAFDAVVGFGGYISPPAYLAAKSLKLPIIIHEQNVRVGMSNKFGAKFADMFTYSFPSTKVSKNATHAQCIGLPMRNEVVANSSKKAQSTSSGLDVLVFGGSLGAKSINDAVALALPELLNIEKFGAKITLTHITGKGKSTEAQSVYENLDDVSKKRYRIKEYAHNLPQLIAKANLVISRAGAGTVHELAAFAKPSVLIPLPIGNGEQRLNAKLLGAGALVVDDNEFNAQKLLEVVHGFAVNSAELDKMSEIAASGAILGASEELARIIQAQIMQHRIKQRKNTHFMAISGAGIAPIASCFEQFSHVTGCDSLTGGHSPKHLNGQQTLVYSSAIKEHNSELKRARELEKSGKLEVLHRSDALDELIRLHIQSVAVAGSHGKTSITAMIASIFDMLAPESSSYVIGAQSFVNGVKTNGGKLAGTHKYIVAEADESDGSFTKYAPKIAVISNIEADHLDYYHDFAGVKRAFITFADNAELLVTTSEVYTLLYGDSDIKPRAKVYILPENLPRLDINVPGRYNQSNAALALAVSRALDIPDDVALKALKEFRGAARRFEEFTIGDFTVVDDYAHHPTEVQSLIDAAIDKYGDNDFVLLFQPHLYSRTRNFASEFAEQLARVKYPIVTKIYYARESQSDFLDVTPTTISSLNDAILTTHTLPDGVKMAHSFAKKTRHKVILSVGAGPTLIPLFEKELTDSN